MWLGVLALIFDVYPCYTVVPVELGVVEIYLWRVDESACGR